LAKELKYQKVLEFNKGYIKKELENFEDLKEDLTKLEKQVQETEEEFRYSTLSKERVRTILKICKDNK
jgi:regulator of sirC expression with transglutaminase-like and TPR domain